MYLEPVENGTLEGVYVAFFEFQGGSGGRCKFVTESATSLRSSQWHAFEELDAEAAENRKGRRELVVGSWLNPLKAELAQYLIQITSSD
jgi:hypothetical protein